MPLCSTAAIWRSCTGMSTDSSRAGRTAVIVEIGNDWLKIAQAEPARGGASISRLHLERIDASSSALPQCLLDAFRKEKFPFGPVISYLPRQMVNIRMLELPSTNMDEIADMVDLQIGKQTPYSKDEIVSDYRIAGSGREGYTNVMLAIVQRSAVRQRYSVFEDAGIEVARMSVSSEGLLNWYENTVSGASAGADVLLDVDSFYTDLMILSGRRLVFTRSILIGANQLLGEYEKWKDKFSLEVKRSIETCHTEWPGVNAGRIWLSGAGAAITNLPLYLGGQIGLPVEVKDCLACARKMPKTPSPKDPQYSPVSLTPLLGVALAPGKLEFNLIPDSVRLRTGLVRKARSLTLLGVLVMALLVAASMYTSIRFYAKKSLLGSLEKEYVETHRETENLSKMRATTRKVEERRNLQFGPMNVLLEIIRQVPDAVFFDSVDLDFSADKGQIRLAGSAANRSDVTTLVKNMELSTLFKDMKEEGESVMKDGRVVFKIVGSLEKGQWHKR